MRRVSPRGVTHLWWSCRRCLPVSRPEWWRRWRWWRRSAAAGQEGLRTRLQELINQWFFRCKTLGGDYSLCGGSSYPEPGGWRWWCQSRACWWPCRCSSQSPRPWPSAAPESRWTGWVAARPRILEWLYPHWQTIQHRLLMCSETRRKRSQGAESQCISQLTSEPRGDSHLSLVHFMVGVGSPTEPQGSRTSFIQGVVTVPPNERILAGAATWRK